MAADAEANEAWYATPRGRWIGERELALLRRMAEVQPGDRLLDAGCGTGWFTRRLARHAAWTVGLDPDRERLTLARSADSETRYVARDARRLPFADNSFDVSVAVTSLCFIERDREAVEELVRVTRRRLVLGLLNRRSLLYGQKGHRGGSGGYVGAHWHSPSEARALFDGSSVNGVRLRSAVFLPGGGIGARITERLIPASLPWGAFLVAAADLKNT